MQDATRQSHVQEPIATDPPDRLRVPARESLFGQARMDLTTDLWEDFRYLGSARAQNGAQRRSWADTPRNEQLISVPVCIAFPRL
jgi:hypothetical protein